MYSCLMIRVEQFRPLAGQIGSYTIWWMSILKSKFISFRPLARQIGIYTEPKEDIFWSFLFPPPLEIDRYLYVIKLRSAHLKLCFRPLSTEIGGYTAVAFTKSAEFLFPAPREVDRQLYISYTSTFNYRTCTFPTPPEVDRQLYDGCEHYLRISRNVSGPSRGRQGAILINLHLQIRHKSFRPLVRQIGSYTQSVCSSKRTGFCFRPLSRQIGSYTLASSGFKNRI